MLRVGVITTGFSKDEADYGGASAMHNFIRELSLSNSADVTVFALYYPYDYPLYELFNTKVYTFATQTDPGKAAKLKIWRKCRVKFEKIHDTNKCDIIHSFWSGESGYVASLLSKKLGIPMVTTICGGEAARLARINYGSQLKLWQKYFVRKTFEQAKVIISLSEYISDKMKELYGGRFFKKVKLAPFGTDEKMFYPAKPGQPKGKLINIAGALPVKSHKDLFTAMKLVHDKFPDYILDCYGRNERGMLE